MGTDKRNARNLEVHIKGFKIPSLFSLILICMLSYLVLMSVLTGLMLIVICFCISWLILNVDWIKLFCKVFYYE